MSKKTLAIIAGAAIAVMALFGCKKCKMHGCGKGGSEGGGEPGGTEAAS